MARLAKHFLCIGLAFLSASPADAGGLTTALFKLQNATATFIDHTQSRLGLSDSGLVRTLSSKLETLQNLASSGVETGAEDSYARSIDFDALLIERANLAPSATIATRLVEDVIEDLKLKIEVGNSGYGASAVLKALVMVSAITVDQNDRPVSGILLGLKPLLYEKAEPMFFFPAPTPTQARFPPGRYIIVDAKSNQIRQRVDIGLDGADEQPVRVRVDQP